MKDLWFGLGLCRLWSAEKNHLFSRAFLSYASYMHVLSAFRTREKRLSVLPFVFSAVL